jgi:hypothetical protein
MQGARSILLVCAFSPLRFAGMRFRFVHLLGESRAISTIRRPVSKLKTTAL